MHLRPRSSWRLLWCVVVGGAAALFAWSCAGATNLWSLLVLGCVFAMLGSLHFAGPLGVARLVRDGDWWTVVRHVAWTASLAAAGLLLLRCFTGEVQTGLVGWLTAGTVLRCTLRGAALGTLLGVYNAGRWRIDE